MHKLLCGAFSLALFLPGCSSGSAAPGTATADVVIAETSGATAGDLERFVVDVSGITLTKRGGATVSVLPRAARVDLVQLGSIGELVGAALLESGSYTSLAMTLDFSDAEVVLADQTTPAVVRDCDGVILDGPLAVEVDFAEGDRPFFSVSGRHLFRLDFDLDQSITVDADANEVEFCAVLRVQVDPTNARPIVAGGVLQSVATDDGTFVVARRGRDGSLRDSFTVATDDATLFQIDGVVHTGGPGLGILPGEIGQNVLVYGVFARDRDVLRAAAVEAGAGVRGNGQDVVVGHVIARSGGAGADATLTVLGASRGDDEDGDGDDECAYGAQRSVTVSLANTKVVRRGTADQLDTDAIGVGQQVEVFGALDGSTLDASTADGVVRLLLTEVRGTATSGAANDRLTVDLARLGPFQPTRFDFTVAGLQEADPDAFVFDVAGLASSGIVAGERLDILAWIRGVGIAGDPDATAVAIVDRGERPARLKCRWSPPLDGVVVSTAPQQIVVDLAAASDAEVDAGDDEIDLSTAATLTLEPAASVGEFRIVGGGRAATYHQFDAFRQGVAARAALRSVHKVTGVGTFDAATQTFRARSLTFVFAR